MLKKANLLKKKVLKKGNSLKKATQDSSSKKSLKKYADFFLADEALYYSTVYPNSPDLGTAHAS